VAVSNPRVQSGFQRYQQALKCAAYRHPTTRVRPANHFGHHLSRLQTPFCQVSPTLSPGGKPLKSISRPNNLKMEMILRKLLKWHGHLCICFLRGPTCRELDVAPAQQARCPCGISAGDSRQQFNQFRPTWLSNPPKNHHRLTSPCSMSSRAHRLFAPSRT